MSRRRPDGVLIEWDIAYVGDEQPGATLPFLIQDRTPREYRVRPSASVSGSELLGIKGVVLGVDNLEAADTLRPKCVKCPAAVVDNINCGHASRETSASPARVRRGALVFSGASPGTC